MSQSAQDGAIIMIGYEWRQSVLVTPGTAFRPAVVCSAPWCVSLGNRLPRWPI